MSRPEDFTKPLRDALDNAVGNHPPSIAHLAAVAKDIVPALLDEIARLGKERDATNDAIAVAMMANKSVVHADPVACVNILADRIHVTLAAQRECAAEVARLTTERDELEERWKSAVLNRNYYADERKKAEAEVARLGLELGEAQAERDAYYDRAYESQVERDSYRGQRDEALADVATLRDALQGMLDHSCVADAGADMKCDEDHAAERAARKALEKTNGK